MPVDLPAKFIPRPGVKQKDGDRVRQAQFGDGYTQESPDGINTEINEYNVSFGDLCLEDALELINFFKSLKGVERIRWKPNHSNAVMLWKVSDRTIDWSTEGTATISCTFERRYM